VKPPIRGVLLDIDGTLLDSNDAHARAWVLALAEDEIHASFRRVRRLIGKGGDKVLAELAGIADTSARGKRITARRRAIFKTRYLPSLHAFPGARDLVLRMKSDALVPVVATSASGGELNALLERAHVADLIERKATSDDAERSKPDPDIVEAAIARSEIPAAELVMLGDTPYDVEAAGRAGVRAIALRSGGWSDGDLAGAVAIYDDVADLLAGYDASPLNHRA
jgi:phosphoglycolate phosphatase-like HAD superfamily hydrolase